MPRWFRSTIRLRITALAAVAVASVLILAAIVLVTQQHRQLMDNVDTTLAQRADDIVPLVVSDDDEPIELIESRLDGFVQLVNPDGRVVAASRSVAGRPAFTTELDPGDTQTVRTVDRLPFDGDPYRLLSRRVDTEAGPAVLTVGAGLDDISESKTALTTSLAVVIPVAVGVLTLLVWWLAGRILSPVEGIRSEVAEIGGSDLHRRVPQPSGNDEISRLARTMNGMLDRLEDSLGRQQRFVADASHELRSPLTRVRAELEVDLARPDLSDARTTHESVLEEVVALQRLVDDLLRLARADAGAGMDRAEPVDLDDLVFREIRRMRAAGRVELDISRVSGAQVIGDQDQLTRAIRNLVDNAEHHAAGRVELALAEVNGDAVLTVSDDGPGIPPDQRERIFERFGRLDHARTHRAGGTGLGLAITREIIGRHGGTVTVDPQCQSGARFVIRIPSSSSAAD